MNSGINYLSTGAWFLPSTVSAQATVVTIMTALSTSMMDHFAMFQKILGKIPHSQLFWEYSYCTYSTAFHLDITYSKYFFSRLLLAQEVFETITCSYLPRKSERSYPTLDVSSWHWWHPWHPSQFGLKNSRILIRSNTLSRGTFKHVDQLHFGGGGSVLGCAWWRAKIAKDD